MTFPKIALIASLSILAACETSKTSTKLGPACDLAKHQQLVGKNIGEVKMGNDSLHRIISPGDVVTMDYNPSRLNVFVDDKGWIGKVTCS